MQTCKVIWVLESGKCYARKFSVPESSVNLTFRLYMFKLTLVCLSVLSNFAFKMTSLIFWSGIKVTNIL